MACQPKQKTFRGQIYFGNTRLSYIDFFVERTPRASYPNVPCAASSKGRCMQHLPPFSFFPGTCDISLKERLAGHWGDVGKKGKETAGVALASSLRETHRKLGQSLAPVPQSPHL